MRFINVILLALLLFTGWQAHAGDFPFAGTITVDALQKAIADGKSPVLIDVRTEAEFSAGHIPGAINIPLIDKRYTIPDDLPIRKTDPIVLYCRGGRQSFLAAEQLHKIGYNNLIELKGHYLHWIQNTPEKPEANHHHE